MYAKIPGGYEVQSQCDVIFDASPAQNSIRRPELDLELELCRRCAPVLLGVKPAALFQASIQEVRLLMRLTGLCPIELCPLDVSPKNQIFIYIPELLERALARPGVLFLLRSMGYGGDSGSAYVRELIRRIQGSRSGRNLFPHEIGIFLGYPLEDVLGFWLSGGHSPLSEGEWKCYSDTERATQLQKIHKDAENVMRGALLAGSALEEVLREYWRP